MEMLRPKPMLIPQRHRHLLTIVPREAINHPRVPWVPFLDEASHGFETLAFLPGLFGKDRVEEVGAVEGLRERDAGGAHAEAKADVVGDGAVGGGC